MGNKMKWQRRDNGVWLLCDSMFSVCRDKSDGRWDLCEGSIYLCTTRYVGTAKSICERLAASPKE